MRTDSTAVAAGLLLGFAADRALGDPARHHPVAFFGSAAATLESATYRDSRPAGVAHVAALVGAVTVGASMIQRAASRSGWWPVALVVATGTWTSLGGTTLQRTGSAMTEALTRDDLADARALLPSLCGRDPSVLDAVGLARAALESVAENTSDATVGVLFWGAVAGLPGVLGYRAVNTLDSMIGYRSERYGRFGWCAARLDDVVNLVPARLTGVLTVMSAGSVGGTAARSWAAWRDDASKHPSPNAGVAEASAAGALGVSLGGRTQYRHGVEIRPTLGSGPFPVPADLARAVRLSALVQGRAAVVSAALAVAIGQARLRSVHRRRGARLLA